MKVFNGSATGAFGRSHCAGTAEKKRGGARRAEAAAGAPSRAGSPCDCASECPRPGDRRTATLAGGAGVDRRRRRRRRSTIARRCGRARRRAVPSGLRRAVDAHGWALRPDSSRESSDGLRKKSARVCPSRHMPPEMGVVPWTIRPSRNAKKRGHTCGGGVGHAQPRQREVGPQPFRRTKARGAGSSKQGAAGMDAGRFRWRALLMASRSRRRAGSARRQNGPGPSARGGHRQRQELRWP